MLHIVSGWPPTSAVEDGGYFQYVTNDTVDKQVWGACYDKLAGTPQASAPTELGVVGPEKVSRPEADKRDGVVPYIWHAENNGLPER